NLISRNGNGIRFQSGTNNVVQGNFIGTDWTGANALPYNVGVDLQFTSCLVGGTTVAARNSTAGGGDGISGSAYSGSRIQGNFIGGTNVTARNVISANGRFGVQVGTDAAPIHDNLIQGNFIGTDITGTNLLGNGSDGVQINVSSSGAIESNRIAGNGGNGLSL